MSCPSVNRNITCPEEVQGLVLDQLGWSTTFDKERALVSGPDGNNPAKLGEILALRIGDQLPQTL